MVKTAQDVLQGSAPYSKSYLHLAKSQPLCNDLEGWGPISSIRYDFTPCFLEVWVLFTAAWGILLGIGAWWYLLTRRVPSPVGKNWHFYAKLVSHHSCEVFYFISRGI